MARDNVQAERLNNGVPCTEKRHSLKVLSRAVSQLVPERWKHNLTAIELDLEQRSQGRLKVESPRMIQKLEARLQSVRAQHHILRQKVAMTQANADNKVRELEE